MNPRKGLKTWRSQARRRSPLLTPEDTAAQAAVFHALAQLVNLGNLPVRTHNDYSSWAPRNEPLDG